MEKILLNSAIQPGCINANINLDLKADSWSAVAIIVTVCASIVAVYHVHCNQ